MKSNRLDEIFQVKGGIPIFAGLYIGMTDEEAEEKKEELEICKLEESSENPIYKYSISIEYDLFERKDLVKRIRFMFPHECSNKDSDFILEYLTNRFYHEKIHKEIETDSDGNLLKLKVDIFNYYYNCSFFNKEGNFIIQLEGIVAYPILYKAFYLMGTDQHLKSFVHKSIMLSNYEANKDEDLNDLFAIRNGLPSVCGMHLGFAASSSSEAEQIIDDILHDPDLYYQHKEYWDISFEVMIDTSNRVDEIIMRLSEEDKDIALKILNHLKPRFLIEKANYYIAEGMNGEFKIYVCMSNDYFSIKFDSPYNISTGRRDIEITIETTEKDRGDLYESLYVMLSDNTHYGFFKAADVFYHYDSENNYSPVGAYDSYEEATEAFQGD
jgi:hypothetical protein